MEPTTKRGERKPDSLDTILDRKIEAMLSLLASTAPRYARPATLGLTTRAAIQGAKRGDYRVVRAGKYVLVDVASFEAHVAAHEIGPANVGMAEHADDPLAGIDPAIRAAFERAARG